MSVAITAASATAKVRRVAAGITEPSELAAIDKLLERLTAHEDAQALRDALIVVGAATVLREERTDVDWREADVEIFGPRTNTGNSRDPQGGPLNGHPSKGVDLKTTPFAQGCRDLLPPSDDKGKANELTLREGDQ